MLQLAMNDTVITVQKNSYIINLTKTTSMSLSFQT